MPEINDHQEFAITQAVIERRRFRDQGDNIEQQWDIRPSLVEVNLFESIHEPVMTGHVVIIDTSSISAAINFQGQEVLHLSWRVGEVDYNRTFYVFSVVAQIQSTNTTTSSFVLHVIERHGYHSMFKRLSGTKAGEIGQIVDATLSEVDASLDSTSDSSQSIRIMENNRRPLDIVRWLTHRATNDIGEPMFAYSTLNPNTEAEATNIKFRSLGDMMGTHPWPDDFVFEHTMVGGASTESAIVRDRRRIHAIHFEENDNVFALAERGGISSQYHNMDLFSRSQSYTQFNSDTHFNDRQSSSSASEDSYSMTDSFFALTDDDDETRVSLMDSVYVSGINNTSMFDGYRGYNEEVIPDNHRFKISRESDLLMLDREKFSITLPGYHFGDTDTERGVGTTLMIKVPKDQPVFSDDSNSVDVKRSGKFLIMNARHIMNNGTNSYIVVLEIGRPDTPDDINSSERQITPAEERPR